MAYLKFKQTKDRLSFDSDRQQAAINAYSSSLSWSFRSGKYAGKPITSVPTSYLVWMRKNATLDVAQRCSDELERRNRIHHSQINNALLRATQVN